VRGHPTECHGEGRVQDPGGDQGAPGRGDPGRGEHDQMAKASGCNNSPKINEVIDVRIMLEKMRRELDLNAIMRR
jgi:hypothetical protein